MRFNSDINGMARKLGVLCCRKPSVFCKNTLLGYSNGQPITVSNMFHAIEYAMKFIKENFDVDQEKYKMALKVFGKAHLMLENKQIQKPKKRELHFWVDVIHEIEDMHAKNDTAKQDNEKIALAFDLLIDMFVSD